MAWRHARLAKRNDLKIIISSRSCFARSCFAEWQAHVYECMNVCRKNRKHHSHRYETKPRVMRATSIHPSIVRAMWVGFVVYMYMYIVYTYVWACLFLIVGQSFGFVLALVDLNLWFFLKKIPKLKNTNCNIIFVYVFFCKWTLLLIAFKSWCCYEIYCCRFAFIVSYRKILWHLIK